MKSILLMIFLGIIFYILYINGYMLINKKKAVLFMGSLYGKNHWKAEFSFCDGYIKRIIKFKEYGKYRFLLNDKVDKGEVIVEIWDHNKNLLINLKDENWIELKSKERYFIIYTFKNASGSFELKWEKE